MHTTVLKPIWRAYLADLLTVTAGENQSCFFTTTTNGTCWCISLAASGLSDQSNDRHFHYGYVIEAAP